MKQLKECYIWISDILAYFFFLLSDKSAYQEGRRQSLSSICQCYNGNHVSFASIPCVKLQLSGKLRPMRSSCLKSSFLILTKVKKKTERQR